MKNKIVIVTGATAGIGKVTAQEIARLGARVIIIARNEKKCREITGMIHRKTGNENVNYLLADLSSIAQTRSVAAQIKANYDRLDVLVNNVGSLFMDYTESIDGLEMTLALNHLVGYFLLTNQLLDLIKASASARIVSVSSSAHFRGQIDFADLQMKQQYKGRRQYANSKLMNLLFTYELARRLDSTGVTVNALHPGVVATNFGVTNNNKWYMKPARLLFNLKSISETKGAETSIYLATSPDVEGITGQYFENCRAKCSTDLSLNKAVQQRLWAISEEMVA